MHSNNTTINIVSCVASSCLSLFLSPQNGYDCHHFSGTNITSSFFCSFFGKAPWLLVEMRGGKSAELSSKDSLIVNIYKENHNLGGIWFEVNLSRSWVIPLITVGFARTTLQKESVGGGGVFWFRENAFVQNETKAQLTWNLSEPAQSARSNLLRKLPPFMVSAFVRVLRFCARLA